MCARSRHLALVCVLFIHWLILLTITIRLAFCVRDHLHLALFEIWSANIICYNILQKCHGFNFNITVLVFALASVVTVAQVSVYVFMWHWATYTVARTTHMHTHTFGWNNCMCKVCTWWKVWYVVKYIEAMVLNKKCVCSINDESVRTAHARAYER